MRKLLESMTKFAGEVVGQKPGQQWRGSDKGTPGTKLVGDSIEPDESILKDLSKGPKPKTREQELAEQFEAFLEQLEEENLGTHPKRASRTSDRPGRKYTKHGEQSERYTYNNEETDSGITKDQETNFHKKLDTLVHDTFGKRKDEVEESLAVNEEQKKFAYNVQCDGYDKGNFVNKNDAIYSAQYMIYYGEKEYNKIEVIELATGDVIWEWHGKKDQDDVAPTEVTVDENTNKDVPVISAFRRGMEKIAASDMTPQEKQAAFDRLSAEFHKNAQAYSDKVKGNRSTVDEAGANNPPQVTTATAQPTQADPKQVAATNQALNTIKAGTQSTAPTPMIAKALDAASQGKPVSQTDMKNIEPMMKDIATVAQDPKLATQFKTLAQQANQAQTKQQQKI